MYQRQLIAVGFVAILLIASPGCWKKVATPPPAPTMRPHPATSHSPATSVPTTPAAEATPGPTRPVESAASGEKLAPDAGDVSDSASEPANDSTAPKEGPKVDEANSPAAANVPVVPQTGQTKRMLLYTPSGPLIVEFVLRIDGRGAIEMNDAFVDELLKAADTDKDGKTTWLEALSNQRSGIPQFVGEAGGDTQKFYDRDRDETVDRSELWNLLGHGESGLAFRLEHSDGPGGATTAGDVARLLDSNSDGVLTSDEMDRSPALLRLADVNDDERLTPDDLGAPAMAMPQQAMNTGYNGDVTTTASILDGETDWGVVHFELDERYLMHGQFRPEPLALFPEMTKKLDVDENGLLSLSEAEVLNYLSPHLRVEIDFGAADAAGGRLQITDMRSELASETSQRKTERSAQLNFPNLTLAFSVADVASLGDIAAQAEAAFMQADQDKNGYVEKAELPENQQASFAGWDGNADGKVYPDELSAALRSERMPLLNRVRAVVTPGEHSLLAALDANRDGSLSAREIHESAKRLRASDRDGDGRVTEEEIPTRISVHFERGMQGNAAIPATYGAPEADPNAKPAPAWFQRMDSNSDGDISPREFLGSTETFGRLDKDADGLLSLDEAVANQVQ